MNLNRRFVIVGLMVCVAGGWLILRPATADSAETRAASVGGVADEQPDGDEGDMLQSESVDPDADSDSPQSGNEGSGEPDAEAPVAAGDGPTGAELADLTPQTIPGPAPIPTELQVDSDCDPSYAGLGVEFRAWGDVLLPYTPGYPTNEPGAVWDCTADTAFGGAIAMTHAAYLEALRPEVIPTIALDTPGRETRIERHRRANETASLGFLCAPIGWNWDGGDTWSLLHQCGEGEAQVSHYRMEYHDGRWWLVYPAGGEIETGPPPEGYEYYPFIGGD